MHSSQEVESVLARVEAGINDCETARQTGLPRTTIRDWRRGKLPGGPDRRRDAGKRCPVCSGDWTSLDGAAYAYLLGQYLGDGCLSLHARGVYRLRIVSDLRYPAIIKECAAATASVLPQNAVGILERHHPDYPDGGCAEVYSYSKHWICLFPQHAPGRKHERPIVLQEWQQRIVKAFPEQLIRGLIHSDGCRHMNAVQSPKSRRRYCYVRYLFSNRSSDIRGILCSTYDMLGIQWTLMNGWTISVARRDDVARVDGFVGPKR